MVRGEVDGGPSNGEALQLVCERFGDVSSVETETSSSYAKVNPSTVWEYDTRDAIRDHFDAARCGGEDCVAQPSQTPCLASRQRGNVRRNAWGSVTRPGACHWALPNVCGGAEGIRTPYLYNANVALYQLSYSPTEAAE